MICKSLVGLTAVSLGLAAAAVAGALPASASVTYVGNAAFSGTNGTTSQYFTPEYGNNGYILFNTTPSGTNSQAVKQTTITVAPSYATITTIGTITAGGYKYNNITSTLESGLVSGSTADPTTPMSFTIASGVPLPSIIQFGVLDDYTGGTPPIPATITLSGNGSSATANVIQNEYTGEDYLFDITNFSPGETFTVSIPSGDFIAGATFDSTAAPEPSEVGVMVLIAFGMGGLLLRAKKRAA